MEIDLSNLDPRMRQALDARYQDKFHRDMAAAVTRQTQTATRRRDAVRWHDVMMPETEIDPFIDAIWSQFYGHNYRENKDLMRFLMNRNPEIALRAKSHKVMVGYSANPKPETRNLKPASRRGGCSFGRGTFNFAR